MDKHPYSHPFIKAIITPFSSVINTESPARVVSRPTTATATATAVPKRPRTSSSSFFLFALTFVILLVSTAPLHQGVEAAPTKMPKHTPAPKNLIDAMAVTFSDKSPLPLQLQMEAQVGDTQKLAYLPIRAIPGSACAPPMTITITPQNTMTITQGVYPNNNLDFYYINYRPTYTAGESKIDFWMLSAMGSGEAPQTASLELMDEFGKVRLAVLVPEGTVVPQDLAAKKEPFLWKSWTIPKTLASEFDFSENFRVVLKTSSTQATMKTVPIKQQWSTAQANNNNKMETQKKKSKEKRFDIDASTVEDLSLVRDDAVESSLAQAPIAKGAAAIPAFGPATHNVVLVQDRHFRIKGLKATPGGKPNPARALFVSHLAPSLDNGEPSTGLDNNDKDSTRRNSGLTSADAVSWVPTLLVVALTTIVSLC